MEEKKSKGDVERQPQVLAKLLWATAIRSIDAQGRVRKIVIRK